MRKTIAQNCPLCGTKAEFYFVDYENRKYFSCPQCTKYQISVRAEAVLAQAPQQWRDNYAEKAKKAPQEHLLAITVPSPAPHAQGATPAITGEFVAKSKLEL